MLTIRMLGAVCGLGILAATSAQAVTLYQCALNGKAGTWISPQVVIGQDRKKGKVFIHDNVTYGFNKGQPMEGQIALENNKRVDFRWTVQSTKSSTGQLALRMEYRGTFLKKNKKFILTASPAGYGNSFRGEGSCKVSEK